LEVSILPHEANSVLGLFYHWQNTTDRILDLNKIWSYQFIGFGFWNEITGLDLKNLNQFFSDISAVLPSLPLQQYILNEKRTFIWKQHIFQSSTAQYVLHTSQFWFLFLEDESAFQRFLSFSVSFK